MVNELIILSDNLNKIRELAADAQINVLMQNKEFFKLAEMMHDLANSAHTCNGLFFSMHMNKLREDTKQAIQPKEE